MRSLRVVGALLALLVVLAAGSATAGCSGPGLGGSSEDTSTPPPAVAPQPPDLKTPVAAVEAYGDWITYAYRVLDSDVATHAFSIYEEVRVNSYVQMLRTEKLNAIEQRLVEHQYRLVSEEGTNAVVAGTERWTYRYIDIKTKKYATPPLEASYDVTYTLVVEPTKGWVVDRVDAISEAEVK